MGCFVTDKMSMILPNMTSMKPVPFFSYLLKFYILWKEINKAWKIKQNPRDTHLCLYLFLWYSHLSIIKFSLDHCCNHSCCLKMSSLTVFFCHLFPDVRSWPFLQSCRSVEKTLLFLIPISIIKYPFYIQAFPSM